MLNAINFVAETVKSLRDNIKTDNRSPAWMDDISNHKCEQNKWKQGICR